MSRHTNYTHAFVERFPQDPPEQVLYISIAFASTMHLCMCGCGEKVITPLDPTDWALTFDGATASLWPSIGNHSYACRSHYILRRGRVQWAERWSDKQVQAARAADRRSKKVALSERGEVPAAPAEAPKGPGRGLRRFLHRRRHIPS